MANDEPPLSNWRAATKGRVDVTPPCPRCPDDTQPTEHVKGDSWVCACCGLPFRAATNGRK